MNPLSITPSQDHVKTPTTLDKIPEDVQLAIIKFIQSWKRSEGTEQEREKGKRARDSALRAVALSCRNLLSIYQRELLSDVTLTFRSDLTLNFRSLFRFYLLLANNRDARKFVRSITLTHRDDDTTREKYDEAERDLEEDLKNIFEALNAQEIEVNEEAVTVECVVEGIYRFLTNIQTLVIRIPEFNIPLRSKWASARLPPLPFLTHSLKKLYIPMWGGSPANLKARNVVWILVFCNGLRSACLSCVVDQNDFKYLCELSDTFSGLSQVQKLSLGINFTSDKPNERYWDTTVGKRWVGGNKKSQAVFCLLKVTKNLQCLEINCSPNLSKKETVIHSSCVSALRSSYLSLKSLRLLNVGVNYADPEEYEANTNLSLFEKLKTISLDATTVLLFSRFPELKFPFGLEAVDIAHYYPNLSIQEDVELARALRFRSLPSLKKVIVHSTPMLKDGIQADSDEFIKRWLEGRRELEKAEVFTSGKVKLKSVEVGEFIGEFSETDFMSTLPWLSPP